MTARTHRPRIRDDEKGVSVVIGAILILGLIVAATVTIRVNYEPIWEKDREATHMRTVEGQFAALKSEMDRQIDNRTNVPVANALALGITTQGFFGSSKDAGILTFTPGTRPLQVSTNRFLVQQEGGTSYLGLQETWTPISGTVNLETVGTVHSLRLRLATLSQNNDGDAVTITLTDADSAFAGDLRVIVTSTPSNLLVTVRVRDASSATLAEVSVSFPNDQAQTPYWVDALRSDYRFDRVLAGAERPLRMTFGVANVNSGGANQDLTADYAATYTQSGTQVVQGGAGLLHTAYAATYDGGVLTYHANNDRFPAQDYILEHGAVLLEQADGSAIRIDPAFQASLSGATTSIVMTVPSLTGTSAAHQGAGTASIYTRSTAHSSISGQAPRWSITLTTSEPELWVNFWKAELLALPGYVENTHFTTSTTAATATVNVYGLTSLPASETYDVYVVLQQAQISIDIKS